MYNNYYFALSKMALIPVKLFYYAFGPNLDGNASYTVEFKDGVAVKRNGKVLVKAGADDLLPKVDASGMVKLFNDINDGKEIVPECGGSGCIEPCVPNKPKPKPGCKKCKCSCDK